MNSDQKVQLVGGDEEVMHEGGLDLETPGVPGWQRKFWGWALGREMDL